MIKAVIIDFDDTLIQTSNFRKELLKATIRQWNKFSNDDDVVLDWGQPFRIMVETLVGKDKYNLFKDFYMQAMLQTPIKLCDGAEHFLRELKRQQIPVVVFSSSIRELIELDLVTIGIMDLIANIVDSESAIKPKPNTEALQAPLKWLQDNYDITASQSIYIGDSLDDMKCADKNIDFYAVLSGTATRQDFLNKGLPECNIYKSLTELLPLYILNSHHKK